MNKKDYYRVAEKLSEIIRITLEPYLTSLLEDETDVDYPGAVVALLINKLENIQPNKLKKYGDNSLSNVLKLEIYNIKKLLTEVDKEYYIKSIKELDKLEKEIN